MWTPLLLFYYESRRGVKGTRTLSGFFVPISAWTRVSLVLSGYDSVEYLCSGIQIKMNQPETTQQTQTAASLGFILLWGKTKEELSSVAPEP